MKEPMILVDSQQSAKQAKYYSDLLMKEPVILVDSQQSAKQSKHCSDLLMKEPIIMIAADFQQGNETFCILDTPLQ